MNGTPPDGDFISFELIVKAIRIKFVECTLHAHHPLDPTKLVGL
jgi:hypothetical protein